MEKFALGLSLVAVLYVALFLISAFLVEFFEHRRTIKIPLASKQLFKKRSYDDDR